MKIPADLVGLFIGKGGETIKDLRERHGLSLYCSTDSLTMIVMMMTRIYEFQFELFNIMGFLHFE